jgi:uncharacterized protein YoxC
MEDSIERRLEAVERALTDGDHDLSALGEEADALERLDALAADVESLGDRVAELEAATQAIRGYVGNVRAVNQDVEQRADLALSKAEAALEDASKPVSDSTTTDPGITADDDRPGDSPSSAGQSWDPRHNDSLSRDGRSVPGDGESQFATPRTDDLEDDPERISQEICGCNSGGKATDRKPSADGQAGLLARARRLL